MPVTSYTVTSEEEGIRLDRFFKRKFPDIGHGAIEKALRKGEIRVNGKRAKANTRLAIADIIRIPPFASPTQKPGYKKLPGRVTVVEVNPKTVAMLKKNIIYKDPNVIVINKPAGLAVQGGSKITESVDSMLDHLMFDYKERPKLVHRLDKDTSGVLVLARTSRSAAYLSSLFKGKNLTKEYVAIVVGVPEKMKGKIDVPIAKSEGKHEKVRENSQGQKAISEYEVLDTVADMAALVKLRPITGRTHQLRVHMEILGTPILGDGKYGGRDAFIEDLSSQLHLHAWRISYPDDRGKVVTVTAELPEHIKRSMKALGLEA
jgi:23S rRNA pseudouridine955/2504/2580 synthase